MNVSAYLVELIEPNTSQLISTSILHTFTEDPSDVKNELKRNVLIFNTWRERFQICPTDKRLSHGIDYLCHTLEIVVKRLI